MAAKAPTKPKKESAKGSHLVRLERENKNDTKQFISVNGKRILIKKGETVGLSKEFAEVIGNARNAAREAQEYSDSISADD